MNFSLLQQFSSSMILKKQVETSNLKLYRALNSKEGEPFMIYPVYETTKQIVICDVPAGDAYFIRNGISPASMTGQWSISVKNTNTIAYMGANADAKPAENSQKKKGFFSTTPGSAQDLCNLKENPVFIVFKAEGDGNHEIVFSAVDQESVLLRYSVTPSMGVIVRSGCFLAGQVGVGLRGYTIPKVQMKDYMHTGLSMARFYGNADIWVAFRGGMLSFRLEPNQTCRVNPTQLVMFTRSISIEGPRFLASDVSVNQYMAQDSAMLVLKANDAGGEYFLSAQPYPEEKL